MARIDSLLEAYDDAVTGAVSTGFISLAGYHCGVGCRDGEVSVWLAEHTDREQTFDPADYPGIHQFEGAVFDWLGELDAAR